jgi:low affinity Fe/Cu permease
METEQDTSGKSRERNKRGIEQYASKIAQGAGSNMALIFAVFFVLAWIVSGFFMRFTEDWALVMATASAVVTFIMVFLIQKSQNKDSMAIQLKLNELVAANEFASNRLVDVEGMTEDELRVIKKYYSKLGVFTKTQDNLQQSHSIEEEHREHTIKNEMEKELESIQRPKE